MNLEILEGKLKSKELVWVASSSDLVGQGNNVAIVLQTSNKTNCCVRGANEQHFPMTSAQYNKLHKTYFPA